MCSSGPLFPQTFSVSCPDPPSHEVWFLELAHTLHTSVKKNVAKVYCIRKMLCNIKPSHNLIGPYHILGISLRNLTLFTRLFLVERDGHNTRPSEDLAYIPSPLSFQFYRLLTWALSKMEVRSTPTHSLAEIDI